MEEELAPGALKFRHEEFRLRSPFSLFFSCIALLRLRLASRRASAKVNCTLLLPVEPTFRFWDKGSLRLALGDSLDGGPDKLSLRHVGSSKGPKLWQRGLGCAFSAQGLSGLLASCASGSSRAPLRPDDRRWCVADPARSRVAALFAFAAYDGRCGVSDNADSVTWDQNPKIDFGTSYRFKWNCPSCQAIDAGLCRADESVSVHGGFPDRKLLVQFADGSRYDVSKNPPPLKSSDPARKLNLPDFQAVEPLGTITKLPPLDQGQCRFRYMGYFGAPMNNKNPIVQTDFGYAGIDDRNHQIVLAFRGTQAKLTSSQWVPFFFDEQLFPYQREKVRVHEGLWAAYGSVRSGVLLLVMRASQECRDCSLLITGHSRGGGLSMLAAADLAAHQLFRRPIDGIAFSPLAVGNVEFGYMLRDLSVIRNGVIRTLTSHINYRDPVPWVRNYGFGTYHHAGNVVYQALPCDSDKVLYRICRAGDSRCAPHNDYTWKYSGLLNMQLFWKLPDVQDYIYTCTRTFLASRSTS